ncbi:hypothetical protein ABPG74_018705 [Tetrahymena malaccensis]
METQNRFLVNSQINARISAANQDNNNLNQTSINLYLWDGQSLKVDGNQYNQKLIYQQSQFQFLKNSEVITDILQINQNRYSIICLSDGQLLIKKNNHQNSQNQQVFCVQQRQQDFYNAYCRLGFFSYEDQYDQSKNQYYLLAVDYNHKISIYNSQSIENFSSFQMEKLKIDFLFVQYDEINQVFLALCKDLSIYCYKMNEQNHNLEQFQIVFNQEDLKNLGIDSQKDFVAFDFQYKDQQLQIFIVGKLIGIFNATFNDIYNMDDSQNILFGQLIYVFDPFELQICRQCDRNYKQIFCDKRKSKFGSLELTIILDKLVIKVYLKEDRCLKIIDLKDPNDSNNFQKIDQYICLYGSSQNTSYHILYYTNCQQIEDSFKQFGSNKIYIHKEN